VSDPTMPSGPSGPSGPSEGVGGWTEEAAKLLGALSGLAREHGGDLGDGWSRAADRATSAAHDLGEHLATDGPDCTWCPLCRTIAGVRQTSPEVRDHLLVAASSLVQAAAGMLATHPSEERRAGDAPRVEHIDLAGDVPDLDDTDFDLDESEDQ
jgi:hypothetical protein